jgi:PAS domain S-box-containing protein
VRRRRDPLRGTARWRLRRRGRILWDVRLRQIAPALMIIGVTVAVFFGARFLQERDAGRESLRRINVVQRNFGERIALAASLTESLRRFMVAGGNTPLTSRAFKDNASRWLRPPGFPAAAWVERVPASGRAEYERRAGHPIVDRDRHGGIAHAGARTSYAPASLVSGAAPAAVAGMDLLDEAGLGSALERASSSGDVQATPLLTLRDGGEGLFLVRSAPRVTDGAVRPGFVVLFFPNRYRTAAADTGVTLSNSTGEPAAAGTVSRTVVAGGQRFRLAQSRGWVSRAGETLPWLLLGAGFVLAVVAAALGVIAQRRAKAQQEVDRIFTLSSDMIAVADFDGYFTRVNPAAEKILGYTTEELLARPYLDFVHRDDRDRTVAEMGALARGQATLSFENRYVRKDGSRRVLEWTSTPVVEDRLTYAVARDVTGHRQTKWELDRLVDEQQALRRVATLAVQGVPAADVFAAVAAELERLFDARVTLVGQLEPGGKVTIVGSSGSASDVLPVGARLTLESGMVLSEVIRGSAARSGGDSAAASEIRCWVAVPIMVQGAVWGAMGAGTDRAAFRDDAEQRMAGLSELIGTAIANTEAREALAASRARIVEAADHERRRLVRDLHDGAQQSLVHTIITLQLARQALEQRRAPESELVTEALEQAGRANVELRELAHGILPSALTRGGLRAGVKALAGRMPVPVTVDVPADRLPAAVEAAAYFVTAESLTNVAKHAQATSASVWARLANGGFELQVSDDGIGGARSHGSGFVGLADRLAVLDGRLRVHSPPGGGTVITAHIPLDG